MLVLCTTLALTLACILSSAYIYIYLYVVVTYAMGNKKFTSACFPCWGAVSFFLSSLSNLLLLAFILFCFFSSSSNFLFIFTITIIFGMKTGRKLFWQCPCNDDHHPSNECMFVCIYFSFHFFFLLSCCCFFFHCVRHLVAFIFTWFWWGHSLSMLQFFYNFISASLITLIGCSAFFLLLLFRDFARRWKSFGFVYFS